MIGMNDHISQDLFHNWLSTSAPVSLEGRLSLQAKTEE